MIEVAIRMRRGTGLLGAAVLLLSTAIPAAAHHPSDRGNKLWSNGATATYKWDSTAPAWLKTQITAVLETHWMDTSSNNSKGPTFDWPTDNTGSGTVYFKNTSITDCDDVVEEWLGCADGSQVPKWKIWIRKDPKVGNPPVATKWCQDPANNDPNNCWNVRRIGIHEALHVGGHIVDLPSSQWMSESNSVIRNPPYGPGSQNTIARCDEAAMQLFYGVRSRYGPIPDCYHELDHTNSDGSLKMGLSAAPDYTAVCVGDPVTISGRFWIGDYANYEALGDANLAGRQVKVYGNSSLYSSTDTNNTAKPGNNWSLVATYTTQVTQSFSFYASFIQPPDEPALGSKTSSTFAVTWYRDIDC